MKLLMVGNIVYSKQVKLKGLACFFVKVSNIIDKNCELPRTFYESNMKCSIKKKLFEVPDV